METEPSISFLSLVMESLPSSSSMKIERSISFFSLGMESLPSTSFRCPAIDAKPLRSFSAFAVASSSTKSILAAETLVSSSSLSVATVNKPAQNQSPEAKKDGKDMVFSRNGSRVSIKASHSDSSLSIATVDDQFVQNQNPQVKKNDVKATGGSRKGFRLFGIWISVKEACGKKKLGLQETSKPIKKRAYTRRIQKRAVNEQNAERAEHASGSYKENIGELLAEKVLTKSDIDSSSRLLLSRDKVEKRLIPILNENYPEAEQLCKSLDGLRIQISDADTENGDTYMLVLKQWVTKSFVFTGNWKKDFVKRRNLKEDDQIGLFWDQTQHKLNFSVKQSRL